MQRGYYLDGEGNLSSLIFLENTVHLDHLRFFRKLLGAIFHVCDTVEWSTASRPTTPQLLFWWIESYDPTLNKSHFTVLRYGEFNACILLSWKDYYLRPELTSLLRLLLEMSLQLVANCRRNFLQKRVSVLSASR